MHLDSNARLTSLQPEPVADRSRSAKGMRVVNNTLVIPMLVCRDAKSEIEFCKTAFGAEELSRRLGPDGTVVHATLAIDGALIMVHGEYPNLASRAPLSDGSSPVVIYIYVADVDAAIARAVAAGASVLLPVTDQFWGDRTGRIIDSSGHVWNVATRRECTKSEQKTS
jgi:PhnB protein